MPSLLDENILNPDILKISEEDSKRWWDENGQPVEISEKRPKKKFKFKVFQSEKVKVYRIGHYRPFNRKLKRRALSGSFLNVYDYGYKLKFKALKYDIVNNKFCIRKTAQYCLSFRKSFNLYKKSQTDL